MKKIWTVPTAALVLGLAALGGCAGADHGKYTEEQRNAAKHHGSIAAEQARLFLKGKFFDAMRP